MLRHLVLLLLLPLALAAAPDPIWPEIVADLPPDPALHSGELPNGLRYAVLRNTEPRDRISLRLLVRAGSLHERDDERGLAHFLEHMAFRGTRRHPNGTLTTELQRLGIGFGPDSTAFTHFDHTIYHLELPDTREPTLRQGLEVFREYAGEITFDPALIERERGVILSELRTRDRPGDRVWQANVAFLWPDSLYARRLPIGTEASIRALSREQFVAFYDAWYRPERMAVIVVGDVSPENAARLIAETFASFTARAPPRPEISSTPETAAPPNIRVFSDDDLIGAICSLVRPYAEPRAANTHERRVRALHRNLAFALLERRLAKLARETDGSFVSPFARINRLVAGWNVTTLGASGTIADWRAFMSRLEQEHRRAFLHGFTASELAPVKTHFVTAYEEAVRTRATHPSSWLAGELAASLLHGEVFTTPAALQNDLAEALAAATPADCLAAFREVWSRQPPHVFVSTHPQFAVKPSIIAEALNASRAVDVAAPAETAATPFAYTDFGPPAAPSLVSTVPDLAVRQAQFPNGVRLNFKTTDFEADTVHVYVRIGHGRLSEPRDKPGLALLANLIVPQGGLGRHTYSELQDISGAHAAAVSFYVDDDAFAFNARCAPRDLPFCLQLITAYLTDSAYRPDAMREIHAAFGSLYSSLAAAPGGPITASAERLLAGGDHRFGVPFPDQLYGRTIDEVTAWLEPQFKSAPIELGIVGATDWETAAAAVSHTLATLPPRASHATSAVNSQTIPRPAKPAKSAYVYTTAGHLRQVALAWLCPAPNVTSIAQERRCRMLAELIGERLRVRLREEIGATYNCSAAFTQREGFPSLGHFMIYAEVNADVAERAANVVRKELAAMRRKPFTEDEFARVQAPFLRMRQDDLRTNTYWGHTVLRDAQQKPFRLEAARNRTSDTAAITRQDLERLAKEFLHPKNAFEFVAYPGQPSPVSWEVVPAP